MLNTSTKSETLRLDFFSYLRALFNLMKPRVMSLVIFTCVVGLLIAPVKVNFLDAFFSIIAVALGSGAAGTLNMWYEADLDSVMSRTCLRPIPTGKVTKKQALIFGISASIISIVILYLFSNLVATTILAITILFYVVIYTIWLKKKTSWNIVIGGFAGSAAAFTGWSAITGYLEMPAIIMGILVFLWTPSHFWSLAVLKKDDYSNANIPMLPSIVGKEKAIKYIVINTLLLIPFSLLLALYGFGMIYLGVAVLTGIGLLYTNIRMIKEPENNQIAWNAFKFSSPYLAIVFLAMVIDTIIRIPIM